MASRRYYVYAEHSVVPFSNRAVGALRAWTWVRRLIKLGYKVSVIPIDGWHQHPTSTEPGKAQEP